MVLKFFLKCLGCVVAFVAFVLFVSIMSITPAYAAEFESDNVSFPDGYVTEYVDGYVEAYVDDIAVYAEQPGVQVLIGAAGLSPSDNILNFVKSHAYFSAKPYSIGGTYYIGYGVACNPNDYPNGITEAEAVALLRSRLVSAGSSVQQFLNSQKVTVTQNQFDALVSMTYSLGPSWLNVVNRLPSYLVNGIDKYSEFEIVNAFATWCHVNGAVDEPALNYRLGEALVFVSGDYSSNTSVFCRLRLDGNGGTLDTDVWCYRVGQAYGVLPEPVRTSYRFAGWRKADGSYLKPADIATGTISVTAVWYTYSIQFADVLPDHWFYEPVMDLAGKDIIHGFSDGLFHPHESVTRGQALKLVVLAAGYGDKPAGSGEHWAAGYRKFAVDNGFIKAADYANLDQVIIRDQIADLVASVLKLSEVSIKTPFVDSNRNSVLALYQAGIIVGSINAAGERVFNGSSDITRAEMATVIQRVFDYVKNGPPPAEEPPEQTPPPEEEPEGEIPEIPDNQGSGVKPNPYDKSKFYTKNGRVYYDDPNVKYGIDVSYYQGNIDWKKVASDGISFAIIRAGYRGAVNPILLEDVKFAEYAKGAKDAGLDIGVYYFSQAVNANEAAEEARHCINVIKKYGVDPKYPIAYDWEPFEIEGSRTATNGKFNYSVLTDCSLAFCKVIEEAGYTPVIYANPWLLYTYLDLTRLAKYDVWLAHYTDNTDYKYDFKMWQYGANGGVAGISTFVDMNISFVDYAKRR